MKTSFLRTTPVTNMNIAAVPQLMQGAGTLMQLPGWLMQMRHRSIAVLTGRSSFRMTSASKDFLAALDDADIAYTPFSVENEPSPEIIDSISADAAVSDISCVIGIGGGAVLDAAKAVSAMVSLHRMGSTSGERVTVVDYLEGVGTKAPLPGRLGLVTVPTTSGTGSEATKNAVISRIGENGFKKSLRHDTYVPDLAILDPVLTLTCPVSITKASGLDAITQLLEGYVSKASTSFTDVLAAEGLALAGRAFPQVCVDGSSLQSRNEMSYAAYLSGIVLANANLGVVHGAAGLLGGIRNIPHGVACATLLAESTKMVIDRLVDKYGYDGMAIMKYANAGYCLNFDKSIKNVKEGVTLLLDTLFKWQDELDVPGLSDYGFSGDELTRLSGKTALKNTPINLTAADIGKIFAARL